MFQKVQVPQYVCFYETVQKKFIGFDSQKSQEMFLFFKTSRTVVGTLYMADK